MGTIIAEPKCLGQVYEVQTDPSDSEMFKIQVDTTNYNAKLKIVRAYTIDLVYWVAKPGLLYPVVLWGRGLG